MDGARLAEVGDQVLHVGGADVDQGAVPNRSTNGFTDQVQFFPIARRFGITCCPR
jgi:hypothetical protein